MIESGVWSSSICAIRVNGGQLELELPQCQLPLGNINNDVIMTPDAQLSRAKFPDKFRFIR